MLFEFLRFCIVELNFSLIHLRELFVTNVIVQGYNTHLTIVRKLPFSIVNLMTVPMDYPKDRAASACMGQRLDWNWFVLTAHAISPDRV